MLYLYVQKSLKALSRYAPLLLAAALPGGLEGEEKPAGEPLAVVLERLKERFPDRSSVREHAREIVSELLELARSEAAGGGATPARGKARLLAAEILLLRGETREARDLLAQVASEGPSDDDRARALYLLGDTLFFREVYGSPPKAEGRPGGNAAQYWEELAEKYPESHWARRVERPLRYLRLLGGGPVPEFREKFSQPAGMEVEGAEVKGAEVEYALTDLRGKAVVLDFWRSTTPGQVDVEKQFAKDMTSILKEYQELRGKVVILGVNLDSRHSDFEAAVQSAGIPWPQHHDGQGFETPLARLLGIPREPHYLVLDPEGRVAYLGASEPDFRRALTRELKRLRGVPVDQGR